VLQRPHEQWVTAYHLSLFERRQRQLAYHPDTQSRNVNYPLLQTSSCMDTGTEPEKNLEDAKLNHYNIKSPFYIVYVR
jgi:hypothetical protein